MLKYRSVRYIFYVVVKFVNLHFIIRIKLVVENLLSTIGKIHSERSGICALKDSLGKTERILLC